MSASIPHWTRYACFLAKFCRLTEPARMWWARRLSERIAQGQSVSALNTGSYCDARKRLPITLPVTLGTMIGERLESMTPSA